MDKAARKSLYEKLYYQELEAKDKIIARVQVVIAFILTSNSVLIYIVRNMDWRQASQALCVITGLLIIFFVLSICSTIFLVRSFWGNAFKYIPTPMEIDNYLNEMERHNRDLAHYRENEAHNQKLIDPQRKLDNWFYDELKKCASYNAEVNQIRSERLHQAVKFFLLSMLPLFFAGILFVASGLDLSSPLRKAVSSEAEVAKLTESIRILDLKYKLLSEELSKVSENKKDYSSEKKEEKSNLKEKLPKVPEPPKTRVSIEDNRSKTYGVEK